MCVLWEIYRIVEISFGRKFSLFEIPNMQKMYQKKEFKMIIKCRKCGNAIEYFYDIRTNFLNFSISDICNECINQMYQVKKCTI